MLTVHHLNEAQSERIVWLCEELAIPYALQHYRRRAEDGRATAAFKALHPLGMAPVITDGDLVLPESGAIVEYIVAKHGGGRLSYGPDHPLFAIYKFWMHFANGSLHQALARNMDLARAGVTADHPTVAIIRARIDRLLGYVDDHLSRSDYLAGEFSAADIMIVFSLTTMLRASPVDISKFSGISGYIGRIGDRPAYRRAVALCAEPAEAA